MIEKTQIVQTTAQPAAIIRFTIPREEIQKVMGPAFQELMGVVGAQGIGPAGAFFSHHFRMDPGIFDFVVGVPVSVPVSPTGRVEAGELPAATVARTVYQGGYEGLGEAWGAFNSQIASEGHKQRPDLWESYVTGPESSPDPANWRTELNRPLEAES